MNIESNRNDFFFFFLLLIFIYSVSLMSAFYALTNTQAHEYFPRSGHLVR